MTRPSPSQARAILVGALATLSVAAVTAATKQFYDAKLDASRFERDSISSKFEHQIDHAALLRIDSATARIEARLSGPAWSSR